MRIFLACSTAALLTFSQYAGAAPVPTTGGTYIFASTLGEPDTYDCHATNLVSALHRLAPHYSLLIKHDSQDYEKIVGDVAESWAISPDGKTYTFKLRNNVKFHDGSILSAADVKATYDRLRAPPDGVISYRLNYFRDIQDITTPDSQTVVFTLSQANASMLEVLAAPYNCLYSAAKLAQDPRFPARNIMGTGPFRFVKHDAGAEWLAERFDGYFLKGRPYLDGLRIMNMAPPAAVNALTAGQIMTALPGQSPAEIARVAGARGDAVKVYDPVVTTVMFAVSINASKPPFDDVRVRRALNLAIDRRTGSSALSKSITASAFGTFIREGSADARPGEEVVKLPGFGMDMNARRAEARKLLEEAGVKDLKLQFLSWGPYTALGVFLIDQWRQIGVTATQEVPEAQTFFERQKRGNFEVTLDAVAEYTDDPTLRFAKLVSYSKNPTNLTRADDPVFDALYEQQTREIDPQKRRKLVWQIEDRLLDQANIMPLFWSKRNIVMDAHVKGAATPFVPSNYVGLDQADVWMDK